ncbi:hypothetical protein [Granulicoccus phenolivorans]|uniref:hypothetical protein n=1 Tax=Granulicoccus phenolivorans TaxID=266854 RepID=UPI00041C062A|nr:hypothetical protein [Granulicoccus phenolivorans]
MDPIRIQTPPNTIAGRRMIVAAMGIGSVVLIVWAIVQLTTARTPMNIGALVLGILLVGGVYGIAKDRLCNAYVDGKVLRFEVGKHTYEYTWDQVRALNVDRAASLRSITLDTDTGRHVFWVPNGEDDLLTRLQRRGPKGLPRTLEG